MLAGGVNGVEIVTAKQRRDRNSARRGAGRIPIAGSLLTVGRTRTVRSAASSWMRNGGISGATRRGAAAQGWSRAYRGYVSGTNYALGQGLSWR